MVERIAMIGKVLTRASKMARNVGERLEQTRPGGALGHALWRISIARIPESFWLARHFFVVGCGHSGTSITLALLDNHSRVSALSGETMFFYRGRMEQAVLIRSWATSWNRDSVLAEKTPRHVHKIREIRALFPNAVIVGVARNPLDTVASLKQRYGKLSICIERYLRDNRALVTARDRGELSILFRYEDLIERPAETMGSVLRHAGLEVERAVVTNESSRKRQWYGKGVPESVGRSGLSHNLYRNWQVNQPLFDGRGRYKATLTAREVDEVVEHLGGMATELGFGQSRSDYEAWLSPQNA